MGAGAQGGNETLKLYHLEVVQSRQPCILVERRILCLREGLLHQFRIWSAQYRIDDSGIEVCPSTCWWRWRRRRDAAAACGASGGIFDAPAEKTLHDTFGFSEGGKNTVQRGVDTVYSTTTLVGCTVPEAGD